MNRSNAARSPNVNNLAAPLQMLQDEVGHAIMSRNRKLPSVGIELVRRLKGFTESLESTENLAERFTCRTVKLTLEPTPYGPELVKETRKLMRASQAIFARFLGVSLSAVRDWEQGLKPPNGAACRIMDEIRCNPDYFVRRLKELMSPKP